MKKRRKLRSDLAKNYWDYVGDIKSFCFMEFDILFKKPCPLLKLVEFPKNFHRKFFLTVHQSCFFFVILSQIQILTTLKLRGSSYWNSFATRISLEKKKP